MRSSGYVGPMSASSVGGFARAVLARARARTKAASCGGRAFARVLALRVRCMLAALRAALAPHRSAAASMVAALVRPLLVAPAFASSRGRARQTREATPAPFR